MYGELFVPVKDCPRCIKITLEVHGSRLEVDENHLEVAIKSLGEVYGLRHKMHETVLMCLRTALRCTQALFLRSLASFKSETETESEIEFWV